MKNILIETGVSGKPLNSVSKNFDHSNILEKM